MAFAEKLQRNMDKYWQDKAFQVDIKWNERELAEMTKQYNENKGRKETLE